MRLSHARRATLFLSILAAAVAGCADRREGPVSPPGQNQPPLGAIEEPREGAAAALSFKVRGWAGDDRGIRAVRVFLDGELIALGEFAWDRPDVTRAYPVFRHGTDRLGYEATVDAVTAGLHIVRVDAVDSDGVSTDLGVRRISVVGR